jgi:hypothetical protein
MVNIGYLYKHHMLLLGRRVQLKTTNTFLYLYTSSVHFLNELTFNFYHGSEILVFPKRVKSVFNLKLVEGVEIQPSTLYPRN